jgi:hypothetical protein
VPRTGALLAAAIADERAGLTRDDSSLVSWLTDPERVPEDVATALRAVRQRIIDRAT